MKIMYVDASIDGHHMMYLNHLLQAASPESFAVLPEGTKAVNGRTRNVSFPTLRTLSGYFKWIQGLKQIAKEERPDIVHFLDGDSMMRYFGAGFGGLKEFPVVITFHHLFPGKLREISMRRMLNQAARGVFHTHEIENKVKAFGCANVTCISYPCFLDTEMGESREYPHQIPILLALGGTRHDKGLDLLLQALRKVQEPFKLIIGGKEVDFQKQFIKEQIKPYETQVTLYLRTLTDQEVLELLQRADIIVLPYRKIFDGASGPMCEGVYLGKTIVGPGHGSLGQTIRQQHIGYTFESENVEALAECLDFALKNPCIYDETAQAMQKSLTTTYFLESYKKLYEDVKHRGPKDR